MSMTTHSRYDAPLVEFNVDTEMKDVEILRVSPDRILAKGKRYGRMWLLRGLPPEKRSDSGLLRQLREEFDCQFSCREPGMPLTVGIEEIEGLGPCIVQEWREDYRDSSSLAGKDESRSPKYRLTLRRAVILIVAFIALAGALGYGLHVSRLSALSKTAKADLEALRVANRQGEKRMFMLADSLEKVLRGPLISEEFIGRVERVEEDKQERMAEALYRARVKDFEMELERYDRYVMPEVTDDLPVFYDSICALYRRMVDMGGDVDPQERFPQLPEDDRIRLSMRLYGWYMKSVFNYIKDWIPKAHAADEKKKMENGSGKKDS